MTVMIKQNPNVYLTMVALILDMLFIDYEPNFFSPLDSVLGGKKRERRKKKHLKCVTFNISLHWEF